jgi:hypothetical protein
MLQVGIRLRPCQRAAVLFLPWRLAAAVCLRQARLASLETALTQGPDLPERRRPAASAQRARPHAMAWTAG